MRARLSAKAWWAGLPVAAALAVLGLRPAAPPAAPHAPSGAVAIDAEPGRAVSSLSGTTPDGTATASPNDTLVLDPALIRLFDYYLSTVGERPLADIRAQVDRDLDARLRPAAARQAKNLFSHYVDFKAALRSSKPAASRSGTSLDVLRTGLRTMKTLRSLYFSAAETAALFAAADAQAAAALERMAVEQDRALDPAQKRARLAALDAALPADVRAARAAPLAVARLQESAEQMRAQGASEDDVYRMRASAVSPEAANRLADLDREEADWKARIAAYRAERGGILASPGADAQRQEALGALRSRLFTPDEQRRLAAYEG